MPFQIDPDWAFPGMEPMGPAVPADLLAAIQTSPADPEPWATLAAWLENRRYAAEAAAVRDCWPAVAAVMSEGLSLGLALARIAGHAQALTRLAHRAAG